MNGSLTVWSPECSDINWISRPRKNWRETERDLTTASRAEWKGRRKSGTDEEKTKMIGR